LTSLRVIRGIWNAYTAAGGDERIRAVVRYVLFSWSRLLPLFPASGSVLDEDVAAAPAEAYDAASVIHVLYLIPVDQRRRFMSHVLAALRPGGTLILVLNVTRPRWKHWVAYLQELVMVNGLRLTKGATICFQSLEEYVALVEGCGASVTSTRRLDAGRPYAHAVLIARKRGAHD